MNSFKALPFWNSLTCCRIKRVSNIRGYDGKMRINASFI